MPQNCLTAVLRQREGWGHSGPQEKAGEPLRCQTQELPAPLVPGGSWVSLLRLLYPSLSALMLLGGPGTVSRRRAPQSGRSLQRPGGLTSFTFPAGVAGWGLSLVSSELEGQVGGMAPSPG